MKRLVGIALLFTLPLVAWAQDDSQEITEEQYAAALQEFVDSLDKQTGTITLPNGLVTLQVPDSFYYLNTEDADKVLVDLWGNPDGDPTLGMLFPAHMSPIDDNAWAVTIEYEEDGYVRDDDADSIDYNDLLRDMQSDTRDANRFRTDNGYEPIELIGWAAPPHYDKAGHKLHWAKEIKFGEDPNHTLNYNIRVLGRKGVLVLNFIAGMNQLPEIESNLDSVLVLAEFNQGSRYSDFNPSLDKVAAYGLGGLVAGKVLAKTGILAALFIFLKKFGVFIVVAIGGLFAKLFKRNSA